MSSARPHRLIERDGGHRHEHAAAAGVNRRHGAPSLLDLTTVQRLTHRAPQAVFLLHDPHPHPLPRVVVKRRGPAAERVEPVEKEIQFPQSVGRVTAGDVSR